MDFINKIKPLAMMLSLSLVLGCMPKNSENNDKIIGSDNIGNGPESMENGRNPINGDQGNNGGIKDQQLAKVPLVGIFVDQKSAAINPDGSSWNQAFTNIKQAIAAVGHSGKKIYVAAGTYSGAENRIELSNVSGIHLVGGYDAGELYEKDLSKLSARTMTVLDAKNGDALVKLDKTRDISFNGFIFTGVKNGPAVQILGSDTQIVDGIKFSNSKFLNNQNLRPFHKDTMSTYCSAMLIFYAKNIEISHVDFENNQSSSLAGALWLAKVKSLNLDNVKFAQNRASEGGALFINLDEDLNHVNMENMTLIDNEATGVNGGGAMNIEINVANLTMPSSRPKIIFSGPLTHSGNKAVARTNGSLLKIGIQHQSLTTEQLNSLIDMGNSGIELKESPLVHIMRPLPNKGNDITDWFKKAEYTGYVETIHAIDAARKAISEASNIPLKDIHVAVFSREHRKSNKLDSLDSYLQYDASADYDDHEAYQVDIPKMYDQLKKMLQMFDETWQVKPAINKILELRNKK